MVNYTTTHCTCNMLNDIVGLNAMQGGSRKRKVSLYNGYHNKRGRMFINWFHIITILFLHIHN